ncbi:MAG: ACP S-malonyltransferase, partial [Eggerthellaceae bacterium]
GQIVISGEKAAVSYASDLAKESGAKRCIPLAVSGPFHTSLMKPAAEALHTRFLETTFHPMEVPVIFNATARPLEEGKTVAQMLELQVQTSIHFDDSVRYMADCGVDTIVEIGPGKALSKLVKKTVRDMRVFQVEDCVSLEATITALEEMD